MKVMVTTQNPGKPAIPNVVRFPPQPRPAASLPITYFPAMGQFSRWIVKPWTERAMGDWPYVWIQANITLPRAQAEAWRSVGAYSPEISWYPLSETEPRGQQVLPYPGGQYALVEPLRKVWGTSYGRAIIGEVEVPEVRAPSVRWLEKKAREIAVLSQYSFGVYR